VIKFVLVLWSILLIVGCSSKDKSLMKEVRTHQAYYKMLQKTEKVMLTEDNTTKAILTATYLYTPTMHSKRSDANETFIVGLYLEDEELDSLGDIFELYSKTDNEAKKKDKKTLDSNKTKSADAKLTQQNSMNQSDSNDTNKGTYEIKLNGKKPLAIKKLTTDDSRLKQLSFVTAWNTYALVTFKHVKGTNIKLLFKSTQYGKGTLHFSKISKYVFTRKVM